MNIQLTPLLLLQTVEHDPKINIRASPILSRSFCQGPGSGSEHHAESSYQDNGQLPCVWSPTQTHEETGHEPQHQAAPLQAQRVGQQIGNAQNIVLHLVFHEPSFSEYIDISVSSSSERRVSKPAPRRRRRKRQRAGAERPAATTEICFWSSTAARGRTSGWRLTFGMPSASTW